MKPIIAMLLAILLSPFVLAYLLMVGLFVVLFGGFSCLEDQR